MLKGRVIRRQEEEIRRLRIQVVEQAETIAILSDDATMQSLAEAEADYTGPVGSV